MSAGVLVPSPSGQPGCRARRQGRCAPPAAGPRRPCAL